MGFNDGQLIKRATVRCGIRGSGLIRVVATVVYNRCHSHWGKGYELVTESFCGVDLR